MPRHPARHTMHRRLLQRVLSTLFVVLVTLPPELPLLFPPVMAAPRQDEQLVQDAAGDSAAEEIRAPQDEGTIAATEPVAQAIAQLGPDLSPAFVETVDLGNGERGALLSADPIKYLAPDGEWKLIDPRFAPSIEGFSNLTNLMTVQTGARQAHLQVSHSGLEARWTPHALVLADKGREVVLAKPRPTQAVEGILSADGRTVSYPGSWTMAGMDDEIVAGAGEAEHNVLFAQPPNLQGEAVRANARLILRARLEMPPGAQMWANDSQQTSTFTTTGTIQLRDHAGTTTLNLMPALVFEQARPANSMVATYHVTPINLRSWEISMEMPLAWWLDPVRQYPVVWDPMMQVLRAIDVAQVYQSPGCAPFLAGRPDLLGVGRATCNFSFFATYSPVRTLLRFNQVAQLNLPPQAEITSGVLLVAPTDGYININSYGTFHPCVNTRLHPITQEWNPATVAWNNQPAVGNAFLSNSTSYQGRTDPPLCFRPPPYSSRNSGTKYLLQNGPSGIVTDWINGGTNFGLELRATEAEENGCDPRYGCDFVQIPRRSVWPRADRDQFFGNDFEAMQGGGFMLLVRYKGPTLTNNVPFRYDSPVPIPPKFEDENFHRTRHVYTPPARPNNNPQWLVVGSKGFREEIFYREVVKPGLFSYAYWGQTGEEAPGAASAVTVPDATDAGNLQAYAFPMAVATESCTTASCETRSEGDGSTDGSNFLLINANSAQGREMRIDPLAADPKLEVYAVEGSWSQNLPAVTAEQVGETGIRYTYTTTIESAHIVQAFNLSLPENVRLGIQTSVVVTGLAHPTSPVVTHLYPPGGGIYAKSLRHDSTRSDTDDPIALRTFIPPGRGGNHGVVLELPGDKTAFDRCQGEECNFEVDETPVDRTLLVAITVQVCPANAIPTDTGCALIVMPDYTQPAVLWRQVGPYRVFSPAGFEPCGGLECSRRYVGSTEYATIITYGAELKRVAIMAGGDSLYPNNVIHLREHASSIERYLYGSGIFALGKSDNGTQINTFFELSEGLIEVDFGEGQDTYFEAICNERECRGLALGQYDISNLYNRFPSLDTCCPYLRVYLAQSADDSVAQYAEFEVEIMRRLQTINGPQDQFFTLKWQVRAEGYRGWAESPNGTGPFNAILDEQNELDPAPVAGLTYYWRLNWEPYFDEAAGYFNEFRNNDGYLIQPANLGGAWSLVDYVILPFGKAPGGGSGLAMCPGFCGDIRAEDDTWAAPNRQWKLPDITVNQLPNTVMVSSPGNMQVYSTDHPSSIGQANDTYGLSFKTFGAKVELTDGVCPDGSSNQPVPLIKGTTSLSLPGIDPKANPAADASAIPSITASFVLCENTLRQVNITFKYPPGIPIAAPPVLYLDMIGGTVTIGPEHVVIMVDVGFYIGTGAPKIMKGVATLTIDTRGLFDLQANGRIMGVMDGQGHLWVAWNPLDVGIGAQGWLPNKQDWVLTGFVYAHVWRGSGWQNKYPWLAGNDDFHLTASYQAQFKIAEGAAIDEWPIVIPPDDIVIGVELSFGQFCDNDGCTDYEWGIKGKVTILDFDVGIYVSLECPPLLAAVVFPPAVLLCSSFILGSDDHILIDQYGGNGPPFPLLEASPDSVDENSEARARDARLASANRVTVADPASPMVDTPINVKGSAASIMFAFGWVRGAPNFALVKPGGQVITAANAASMGATVTTTSNSILFGIQNPEDGQWLARVTNATLTDDYRIMYFANKATPALTFTAPVGTVQVNASGDSTGTQTYKVQWTPPPNAAQLSMSLFYSATVLNPTSAGYQYGGVIREDIDPAMGEFDWELTHLASGDYRIYATLQDKRGARVSEFGTNQYVGITTSTAPGIVRYLDQNGPPPLNVGSVTFQDGEDGVTICWDVSPAHDLAQYYLNYAVSDIVYFFVPRAVQERVLATVPYAPGARQCTRIGGIRSGESAISFVGGGIAAADASGNISSFVVPPDYYTQANTATHVGPEPPVLSGNASGGNANLSWNTDVPAASYQLFYARETYAGPHEAASGANEGASPITINAAGFSGNYIVSGLPRGYWYAFAVRRFGTNNAAPPSLLSNQKWLLVSDGVDSNGDGCPDDWEAAHQPYDPNGNPDDDGVTMAQECQHGTSPTIADTDGDGTLDGVEVQAGTDPLDPNSVPTLSDEEFEQGALPTLPAALGLEELNLTFVVYTQGANPAGQNVPFSNLGDGSFTLNLTTTQPWLSAHVSGGNIVVNVDKAGLAIGTYTGGVRVLTNPPTVLGAPQRIEVKLIVLSSGNQPPAQGPIYLPSISK